jgi:hypothetical protein
MKTQNDNNTVHPFFLKAMEPGALAIKTKVKAGRQGESNDK